MSGEVPKAKRIPFAKLAPGDVALLRPERPALEPGSIGHTGIYLGAGWMIHSSGQGVAVTPLTGWYRQQFAWGRRLLAEAGLTTRPRRSGQSLPNPPSGGLWPVCRGSTMAGVVNA